MSKVSTSKYLSWALRHGLDELGLVPDVEGFVSLGDLLSVADPKHGLNMNLVMEIVQKCPKQRFGLKKQEDRWFIRANQGHSHHIGDKMDSDRLLKRLELPLEGVFHGTYKKHFSSIQKNGLQRMNRKHIHFAKKKNAVSGKRHDCDLLVFVDMKKAMEDGILFYESQNGVILTEGVEGVLQPKYLRFQFQGEDFF